MTVGQTTIRIATIVEHALRRAGIPAAAQTPEIVDMARTNLYFILMNYTNRGMIFWGMEEEFLVLQPNKVEYATPAGTVDVLNMSYRQVNILDGSVTETESSYSVELDDIYPLQLVFVDSQFVGPLTVSRSEDGVTWETITTVTHTGGQVWYKIDGCLPAEHYRLSHPTDDILLDDIRFVSSYTDRPVPRLNRDDYLALPNRQVTGVPLQYWFDRKLSPTISLWYAPDEAASIGLIQYYRQRQVADVGALTETLEIPPRWMEATVWQLAQNLAIEIQGVDPGRIQLCSAMAQKAIIEAEYDEQDNAPVSILPSIGVYTS